MKRPEISAVLVIKNEEDKIENCLQHLQWVDELIVVDDYSTDYTVKIAKKYTDIIYIRKGGIYDSVSNNKNFGFQKATKDWILSIDADEIVSETCKREILQKIKEDEYTAFYFNFKQFFFGKEFVGPLWTKTKIIRLFKNGTTRYEYEHSHHTLPINGRIGRVENPIYHYGYPDIKTFIRKMNYYTTFDAKLLLDGKVGGLLKKPIQKVTFYHLFIEPVIFFPYYFFLKKNYKDGIHGLVLSILMTFYLFVERAKLWELHHSSNNEKL